MSVEAAHAAHRSTRSNEVLVNKLSGGSALKGSLIGLGSGGARVMLDRPLESGEVIRLTFPQELAARCPGGRMIIGQVRHSSGVPGRHVVGVSFGWPTGFNRRPSRIPLKPGLWSRLRDYLSRNKTR
jgi:hypothetical protein